MEITIFVDEFQSLSQTFIAHKVKALAERGEHVTVVSLGRPQNPAHVELLKDARNVYIKYVPKDKGTRLRRMFVWAFVFARALIISPKDAYQLWTLTRRYDSLRVRLKHARRLLGLVGVRSDIYHFEFGSIAAEYIDYLKKFARPCIVSFRGSDMLIYPHTNEKLKSSYKEVIEHADRIHCTSEAVASQAAQFGDRQKMFINYPSIDASFFKPSSVIERDPHLVITVGNLKWVKGLTYALLAIAQLVPDFPDLRYVIVGDGPSRKELLFYAADLGIRDHVEFYGRATAVEVKRLLGKASVFLLSSVSEGLSNAALEAMAMEVPVVTTDAGGMPEAVDDGVEGFVVPRYDPSAIAAKLRLLLANEDLRKRMGENARQRGLRDFTIERQTEVFLKEYYEIKKRHDSGKNGLLEKDLR